MSALVSITSIPRRADTALIQTIHALRAQTLNPTILLNLPKSYSKWGAYEPSDALRDLPNVLIHRPQEDYGPATKLLGALEYLKGDQNYSHVITWDDDILPKNKRHLEYLVSFTRRFPTSAITIGGVWLRHWPFRNKDGLKYRAKYRYVDAPAGFKGVVYPLKEMLATPIPFNLRRDLPSGVFNDDDAYFGVVLSRLGVPLVAVPPPLRGKVRAADGDGPSAVAEKVDLNRVENEMRIYQDAVKRGLIIPDRDRRLPIGWADRMRFALTRLKTLA